MDAITARALLFNRKLSRKDVDWSIPGVTELDNQLAVLELGEDVLKGCSELALKPDGTVDAPTAMAAAICRSLVLRDTNERLCTDNDVDSILAWGHSVLAPLNDLVAEVSALSPDALAQAKKNYPIIPASGSDTSLPASLEAVTQ